MTPEEKLKKCDEIPCVAETQEKHEFTPSEVAAREEEIMHFWRENDIFKKSIEKDAPQGEYTFYDGPPFATGLPHYGHISAGTIKDAIPRFWTMNGYRVRRRWGWDCHGLPLENLIEKRLGLATKRDIELYGIKHFNEAARGAVLEYADEWERIVERLGRFVDMKNDYKTMDSSYTESVWWVFKQLHEKGLVYEGYKSMHLCARCGTTLSNFEVNLGYKDIKDIAVTVKLRLIDEGDTYANTSLLVWTTTPWTLPGNMAAAVGKDHAYVIVEVEGGERYVLAKGRQAQLGDIQYTVVREIQGSELVGMRYEPPFDYLKGRDFEHKENAWKIWHADYVEIGEQGTGAVHIAPAYGDDDMNLAREHDVPIVHHVDTDGRFMDFISDWAGYLVKPKDDEKENVSHLDTDIAIVRALTAKGLLVRKENVTHSYPHCWRCDTPLLNYGTTSWFVAVSSMRDKIVAANKQVGWVPKHVGEGRFGKWLEGARDWAVSRQRYWGAPLPIWRNPNTNEYRVFGSKEELMQHARHSGNKYFLMRHGEAAHNVQGVASKSPEGYPLTDEGRKQVAEKIEDIRSRGITRIYTSPLLRTRETAEMIADAIGIPRDAIVIDERLREFDFGQFDERPLEEFKTFRSSHTYVDVFPGGSESILDAKKRFGSFIYEVDEKLSGENVLVVTHGIGFETLAAVVAGADNEESYDLIQSSKAKKGELRELPFSPLPHNNTFALDFHRPYIDEYSVYDEDGTRLERVQDVFDCWFESGAMPYAQHHYPFENKDVFDPEKGIGFPAQFIAESLDQTRGWFYSLMVLGVALFDKSPYEQVIVGGLVLAEDGKKMSKSLQNYPDPMELASRIGVDAMRLYLLSSPLMHGEDLNFSEKNVLELQRKTIGRLHNVLALYEMYAQDVDVQEDSSDVLDVWIRNRIFDTTRAMTDAFRLYEIDRAAREIGDFIDDLSVWYVRRSRERLKGDDMDDRARTLGTLRYILRELSLLVAPIMPFYADYLWLRVRKSTDVESVHLAAWPHLHDEDADALRAMEKTREVVTAALELRAKNDIRVRQPLSELYVPEYELSDEHLELIADEINVKKVTVRKGGVLHLETEITPELKAEGYVRELMRAVQDVRKKMGLEPKDRIMLSVDANLHALTKDYESMIIKTVGANSLGIVDSETLPQTLSLDGVSYNFSVSVL